MEVLKRLASHYERFAEVQAKFISALIYPAIVGCVGIVIVIFFSFWGKAFGRAQLGRIQGTAQMMTVLASAVGPLLLAKCQAWTGSYGSVFYALAFGAGALGIAAWRVKLPRGLGVAFSRVN